MRIIVTIGLLTVLAACETWSGIKEDVVTGVEIIEDTI